MRRTLGAKFLALLLAVSAVALSAALVLRLLVIRDFRAYLEGQREDRVYWITADAERAYVTHGGWDEEWLQEDGVWAWMLGFHIRVLDADGRLVADAETSAPDLAARTGGVGSGGYAPDPAQRFVPYPLFANGERIGTLEVRRLGPGREDLFVDRSNRFLLLSVAVTGGVALLLSFVMSRRLTARLGRVSAAAAAISRGELKSRVSVSGEDEVCALAEAFNRMAAQLDAQDGLRKKLITNLAHDLRTPLGAMRGELEGMMDGLIPASKDALLSLHEETGRLRRMLDGVEELARAQASALTLSKEPVRLRPLLAHVIERFERSTRGKEVSLDLACADDLSVSADPDKLSQVVLNVVDNAVKAVESGGSVRVVARGSPEHVEIAVEDDGVGIDAADLPFIFERFYRRSERGLGVGLAITKELVEAHGGRIDVRSAPREGTTISILLPA
jgi:two-component system sensor histidine kinase BaeS